MESESLLQFTVISVILVVLSPFLIWTFLIGSVGLYIYVKDFYLDWLEAWRGLISIFKKE